MPASKGIDDGLGLPDDLQSHLAWDNFWPMYFDERQTKAPAFALGQFAQTRLWSDGSLCNIELPSVDWVAQSELSVAKHWTAGQSCSVQTASVGPTATGFSGCWPRRAPRKRGKDNVSGVKHSPLERFQSSDKWSLSSWLKKTGGIQQTHANSANHCYVVGCGKGQWFIQFYTFSLYPDLSVLMMLNFRILRPKNQTKTTRCTAGDQGGSDNLQRQLRWEKNSIFSPNTFRRDALRCQKLHMACVDQFRPDSWDSTDIQYIGICNRSVHIIYGFRVNHMTPSLPCTTLMGRTHDWQLGRSQQKPRALQR